MLDGHGDDIKQQVEINFSSNVYYQGCDKGLLRHLSDSLYFLNRYPEVKAESLNQIIAENYGLPPDSVLAVNGAVEAIYLIAQAFANSKTTVFYPTFSEYEDACIINQHKVFTEPFSALNESCKISSRLAFICNPNNPTGNAIPANILCRIIKSNPDVIFIVDEAYDMFTPVDTSCVSLLPDTENLLIIRSLTKQFSIPGLRLGYVLSNAQVINKITKYKMPWTVNALAIEAGKYIYRNLISDTFPINELMKEALWLRSAISAIPGFKVFPSDTTFFTCVLLNRKASELKEFLLNNYGILIRDASNFRGFSYGHFRLAVQNHEHNLILLKALKEW